MLSENKLYLLLIQEPENGLEKIMEQYMAFVYTIVSGKLHNTKKQDIEECVSDIFYEVYKTRATINLEKGSLKTYLTVLSKRKAIDYYRKHCKKTEITVIDDEIASDINLEKDVIDIETSDMLIREIKALGEPDSQIIVRKYYFDQSAKIISKALGIKINTVDKRASRALVKLRHAMGGAL